MSSRSRCGNGNGGSSRDTDFHPFAKGAGKEGLVAARRKQARKVCYAGERRVAHAAHWAGLRSRERNLLPQRTTVHRHDGPFAVG